MSTPQETDRMYAQINELISRNALFVINHSAGKDSQAMMARLARIIPTSQMLVIHADLGEVEWDGNLDHIKATIPAGVPFLVCKNENKTFLEMVERRGMWPSPSTRQCTSDLKRGPIERTIRHYLKANPQHNGLVVNCMGIRAEESASRAKAQAFKFSARNSKAGREWYDWLPIFDLLIDEVWAEIAKAGQEPHPVYAKGMTRLSCAFCIMASKSDLCTAAKLRPGLFKKFVEMEKKIGHTFSMTQQPLEAVTGIKA